MTCPQSQNGSHILVCGTGTPKGTPAVCRMCGTNVWIPPARVHNGKWTATGAATIPGMGLSAKKRLELEYDYHFSVALVDEGMMGCRE